MNTIDPRLLQAVAARLASARQNPPTVLRTLLQWTSIPLLLIVGAVGSAVLVFLTSPSGSGLTSHWPVGFAAMFLGAVLRDVGLARKVARLWLPQSHFIDWDKVNEFTA